MKKTYITPAVVNYKLRIEPVLQKISKPEEPVLVEEAEWEVGTDPTTGLSPDDHGNIGVSDNDQNIGN